MRLTMHIRLFSFLDFSIKFIVGRSIGHHVLMKCAIDKIRQLIKDGR